VFWFGLCEIIQGSDIEMIQEVIDSKDLDDVMKKLAEVMK
jgi:hypothetical protein